MVREKCVVSEMPITFSAGVANMRERARRAGHAVATRLITGVRDVACTRFVARVTPVPSGHSSSKICDYVIVPFDIVIDQINSFDRVDLRIKNYVFTAQTVIDNWLVLPKVFLETDQFRNTCTVRQIDRDCLEQGLDYRTNLPALTIRFVIGIITYFRNCYYQSVS